MKIRSFIFTCFVLFAFASYAQQKEVKSLTLQQAIELAKKNNRTILNSKIDQQIAEKKVNEILAAGLPQINASGNFNDYLDVPTQVAPNFLANPAYAPLFAKLLPPGASMPAYMSLQFGIPYTASGSVTATQLIFDGTYILGVRASREYVNLARLGVKAGETEIEAAIIKMYYAALLTETNVTMLDNTIATIEKTLNDNRAYYKNGLIEKIDVDRLELSYSNTKIQRDKIADQFAISILVLKLQLGMELKDSIMLADDLEKLFNSNFMAPVDLKTDYSKRPDYQLIEQQIRLQSYDVKRYQYGYGPTLNASFTAQRIAYGPKFGDIGTDFGGIGKVWFPTTIFAINLNIPIFDGFRKSAQIQQSRLSMSKFENDKKNLERTIENDVEQSHLKFERAKQQLDLQKKNMELSQAIYDRANIKYKNGVGSTLELTTAENDMKQSQTNYLGSIYDMLVAQVDLKKALGLLN